MYSWILRRYGIPFDLDFWFLGLIFGLEATEGGIDRPGCSSLPFVRSDLMALWKVVRSRIGAGGVCVWVHF